MDEFNSGLSAQGIKFDFANFSSFYEERPHHAGIYVKELEQVSK